MELITLIFSSTIAAIIFAAGIALGVALSAWYFLCEHGRNKRLKALESAAREFIDKVDGGNFIYRSVGGTGVDFKSYHKFKSALNGK